MAHHVTRQVTRQLRERAITSRQAGESVSLKPGVDLRKACREVKSRPCSYQMVEQLASEAVVIQTGQAITINQSAGGMLLMMSNAPEAGRYLEIHTGPTVGRRAAYLLEVRWTKPIPIELEGKLYLVGCQRTFGPCHYYQF
jgi:hypothetical protein